MSKNQQLEGDTSGNADKNKNNGNPHLNNNNKCEIVLPAKYLDKKCTEWSKPPERVEYLDTPGPYSYADTRDASKIPFVFRTCPRFPDLPPPPSDGMAFDHSCVEPAPKVVRFSTEQRFRDAENYTKNVRVYDVEKGLRFCERRTFAATFSRQNSSPTSASSTTTKQQQHEHSKRDDNHHHDDAESNVDHHVLEEYGTIAATAAAFKGGRIAAGRERDTMEGMYLYSESPGPIYKPTLELVEPRQTMVTFSSQGRFPPEFKSNSMRSPSPAVIKKQWGSSNTSGLTTPPAAAAAAQQQQHNYSIIESTSNGVAQELNLSTHRRTPCVKIGTVPHSTSMPFPYSIYNIHNSRTMRTAFCEVRGGRHPTHHRHRRNRQDIGSGKAENQQNPGEEMRLHVEQLHFQKIEPCSKEWVEKRCATANKIRTAPAWGAPFRNMSVSDSPSSSLYIDYSHQRHQQSTLEASSPSLSAYPSYVPFLMQEHQQEQQEEEEEEEQQQPRECCSVTVPQLKLSLSTQQLSISEQHNDDENIIINEGHKSDGSKNSSVFYDNYIAALQQQRREHQQQHQSATSGGVVSQRPATALSSPYPQQQNEQGKKKASTRDDKKQEENGNAERRRPATAMAGSTTTTAAAASRRAQAFRDRIRRQQQLQKEEQHQEPEADDKKAAGTAPSATTAQREEERLQERFHYAPKYPLRVNPEEGYHSVQFRMTVVEQLRRGQNELPPAKDDVYWGSSRGVVRKKF